MALLVLAGAVVCAVLWMGFVRGRSREGRELPEREAGLAAALARLRELEEQVRHARKLENLGILAGGVAHDFNNLLSGILGNVGLALDQLSADSPLRPLLEDVESAANRSVALATQLLAFAGKEAVAAQSIHLPSVLEEIVSLLPTSLGGGGISLELEAGAWIHADVTHIRQLVTNLVNNAIEALPGGVGRVCIRAGTLHADRSDFRSGGFSEELPEGHYAFVEVSDDGCGMDAPTQRRMFEPFFTTKPEGQGLGLAAVVAIVRSHRGSLAVESELGKGSTFRVLLPLSSPPAETG